MFNYILLMILLSISYQIEARELTELTTSSRKSEIAFFKKQRKLSYEEYYQSGSLKEGLELRKRDQEILKEYIKSIMSFLSIVSVEEEVQLLLNNFERDFEDINLIWALPEHKKYGRGHFNKNLNQIALDILIPSGTMIVLVHELTHFYDKDLHLARNLWGLKNKINEFKEIDHNHWTKKEKLLYGKYWFLKTSYISHYKEFIPRMNACLVFKKIYENSLIRDISDVDLLHYKKVIKHDENCQQLESRFMRKKYGRPNFFWGKYKWQYELLNNYRKYWLKKNNIRYDIYGSVEKNSTKT